MTTVWICYVHPFIDIHYRPSSSDIFCFFVFLIHSISFPILNSSWQFEGGQSTYRPPYRATVSHLHNGQSYSAGSVLIQLFNHHQLPRSSPCTSIDYRTYFFSAWSPFTCPALLPVMLLSPLPQTTQALYTPIVQGWIFLDLIFAIRWTSHLCLWYKEVS